MKISHIQIDKPEAPQAPALTPQHVEKHPVLVFLRRNPENLYLASRAAETDKVNVFGLNAWSSGEAYQNQNPDQFRVLPEGISVTVTLSN